MNATIGQKLLLDMFNKRMELLTQEENVKRLFSAFFEETIEIYENIELGEYCLGDGTPSGVSIIVDNLFVNDTEVYTNIQEARADMGERWTDDRIAYDGGDLGVIVWTLG